MRIGLLPLVLGILGIGGLGIVAGPAVVIGAEQTIQVPPLRVPVDQVDGMQRATVILDSYSYTPQHLVVQAGKPVELLLTSITTITPHNFVLRDEAAGLSIERDVSAGKTVTVQFTPTKPGSYTFYCDKKLLFFPSHREKGMEGTLEVR
ncbi:MAG TPA: cupredoxin domain-containing protein [Nitrospira sp.]|nr:quinol oxidase [Nitrospira sp. NTP1]HQR15422.1 cupredoxin domain-containing protein [Nitrospira sp.]HQV12995.1 cupredoxin domain-containing protein [Nitrospira sp.]